MKRTIFFPLAILAFIQFSLGIALSPPSLAQEWEVQVKPRGTLKVVDLFIPSASTMFNYAEGLVTLDKDNNWIPCLAKDWRWIDDRTIEFKLRKDVTFQNGEEFNAEAVRVNWEAYKKLECPRAQPFLVFPDETVLETIDEYLVRFTFPEPDALAFVKFAYFFMAAPSFFAQHEFGENGWGYFKEPGPWGTGPFRLVEGGISFARPSDRIVLEAYRNYCDPRYPRVERVIFDNTLIGNRKEAMRLCRETEGKVDIVSFIRPLDTLKVAESPFAKVVKSKDITWLGARINQRKRDSKWRDVRLRTALNYAVNRKELWKYAAKGNAYNLEGFRIPPGAYGHDPSLTPWTYNTTKARKLLAEAGYADGFQVKVITFEAWKLEAQIIKRMLERIGLKVKFDVYTYPEFQRKFYIPVLDKPPEEQDWDLAIDYNADLIGHTGATFYAYLTKGTNQRWNEYDPVLEGLYNKMARTLDPVEQEEKIHELGKYLSTRVYGLDIYSPLTLYAVNKEVNFVPQKFIWLRLKETSVTDNHWSVRGEKK